MQNSSCLNNLLFIYLIWLYDTQAWISHLYAITCSERSTIRWPKSWRDYGWSHFLPDFPRRLDLSCEAWLVVGIQRGWNGTSNKCLKCDFFTKWQCLDGRFNLCSFLLLMFSSKHGSNLGTFAPRLGICCTTTNVVTANNSNSDVKTTTIDTKNNSKQMQHNTKTKMQKLQK